ncbi:F0F1 ATP synthase subunit gamma [Pelagibius marinus]|uniref:F0F1 ATP synthase subunit gamma n=1 Tax=Pelagibius marinus TaxID=2762760 RepID=UPI0018724E57|nr:F0F1 ATP synthase subunit gamma [Pelagibius marinus]
MDTPGQLVDRPPGNAPAAAGCVVSVSGSLVDVAFPEGELPPALSRGAGAVPGGDRQPRCRLAEERGLDADRSIDDKLDGLRRRENALRQEAITTELLDVVTGSEAILTPPER